MIQKLFLFLSLALVAKMGFSQDLSKIDNYMQDFKYKNQGDKNLEKNYITRKIEDIKKQNISDDEKKKLFNKLILETQEESFDKYNYSLKMAGVIDTVCNGLLGDDSDKPEFEAPVLNRVPEKQLNMLSIDELVQTYASTRYEEVGMLKNYLDLVWKHSSCLEKIRKECPSKSLNDSEFNKLEQDFIKPDSKPTTTIQQ